MDRMTNTSLYHFPIYSLFVGYISIGGFVQRSLKGILRSANQRPDLPRTIWHDIDLVADSLSSIIEGNHGRLNQLSVSTVSVF